MARTIAAVFCAPSATAAASAAAAAAAATAATAAPWAVPTGLLESGAGQWAALGETDPPGGGDDEGGVLSLGASRLEMQMADADVPRLYGLDTTAVGRRLGGVGTTRVPPYVHYPLVTQPIQPLRDNLGSRLAARPPLSRGGSSGRGSPLSPLGLSATDGAFSRSLGRHSQAALEAAAVVATYPLMPTAPRLPGTDDDDGDDCGGALALRRGGLRAWAAPGKGVGAIKAAHPVRELSPRLASRALTSARGLRAFRTGAPPSLDSAPMLPRVAPLQHPISAW